MPQINRIRVNNVKYNFGTQYYDDFVMRFNCKNTIYDLANGGGKSLLMLLLMQNVIPNCTLDEKQPIEKLFRTGCDNTVIHSLVEWKLDACYRKDNYKYMTTGFCARKGHSKDVEEYSKTDKNTPAVSSDNASIEYFNYCIFYRKFGDNDIKNLPLVNNGERVTYNGLKAYLRELEKNDFNVTVKIFDRKGDYQNFISGYGLFESEWEIIRGINKTEGHVRTYFETNYRTSRKVVEDLLIEEIIQKSFNNRLAVTDDEGKMAKTLLDIKDKLVELSKKNARISNYNSQIAALNDFAEYVGSFKNMYGRKKELKNKLYRMLIKAHQMLKTQEDVLVLVENEAKDTMLLKEEEQKKVQTAQVMTEQISLKSISSFIEENEKARSDADRKLKEAESKLKLMESANDYNDYRQYQKALYEAELAVKGRMRDNTELTKELYAIADSYKNRYDNDIAKLRIEFDKTGNDKSAHEKEYNEYQNSLSQLEKELASKSDMSEYIKTQISDEEEELARLMNKAGIIVAENAKDEYEKNNIEIEKIGHEYEEIEKKCNEKKQKSDNIRQELSGLLAVNGYLKEELDTVTANLSGAEEKKRRFEQLKKVYLTQDVDNLLQVIYETYKQTSKELDTLRQDRDNLKLFIENVKNRTYTFDAPMINRLRKYLSLHYSGCFMQGHEWLKQFDNNTRTGITQKFPFIEYAFVITDGFEKIRHDSVLSDFERSPYMVPLVSSSVADIVDETGVDAGSRYVAFAGKDLSFLYDEACCNSQIKTADEELEGIQERLVKLKDRCDIIWEDYTFVIEERSSYVLQEEKKADDIRYRISENDKKKIQLEKKYEDIEASYKNECFEAAKLKSIIDEIVQRNNVIKSIMELESVTAAKYRQLEEYKASQTEGKDTIRKLKSDSDAVYALIEREAVLQNNIQDKIAHLNYVWDTMRSIYDGNNVTGSVQDIASEYGLNDCDMEELESRFAGLKAALDKDNSDITDKEALVSHYRQSMSKCRSAIEYRGSSFEQIEELFANGELSSSDKSQLEKMKAEIMHLQDNIRQLDGQLDSQNALMNRLEGSIAHGIRQIEEKFGEFKPFTCDNTDKFIEQHRTYIKELTDKSAAIQKKLKEEEKQLRKISVIEKDLERIVCNAGMELPVYSSSDDIQITESIDNYEQVQKEFDKLLKQEFKKQDEFNRNKNTLTGKLESIDGDELARQIKISVEIPEDEEHTVELVERLKETNTFIELEKERISKGIEDMERIKDNFENRCLQTCSNIKTELDRLPKLSNITMDKEVISIISMYIPYIKEEQYKLRMSEYIDETILTAESFKDAADRLKYIRNRLAWKRLFSVIVTDMNQVRIELYKRERIKNQSRYLKYEEAVGSTGQSQGIYIQFLISIINYISSINAKPSDSKLLGKTIFIDNPFGAAKDIYIWEPIFKLLKTNHVQLIVPARGATPAITGRFDVNYILGQKLAGDRQQTVVVDYYSQADNDELEYTKMNYQQTTLKF